MLKLNRYSSEGAIYIAPPHIVALERINGPGACTKVYVSSHTEYLVVKETPEEIMAMPEMKLHCHPLMVYQPGTESEMHFRR